MTTEFYPLDVSPREPYKVEPNYEIGEDYARYLTTQLLEEIATHNPELVKTMPFVCVRVDNTSEYSNLSRYIEGVVFGEELDYTPSVMKVEYESFEEQSTFFLVLDVNQRKPAGTLRVISNGSNGFMSFQDVKDANQDFDCNAYFKDKDINPDTTWDVLTIAVMHDYRRNAYTPDQLQKLTVAERIEYEKKTPEELAQQEISSYVVSGLLYRALYAGARANGIENFISFIHSDALHTLRGLGIPFKDMPNVDPVTYSNNQTYQLCEAKVADFYHDMLTFADNKIAAAEELAKKAFTDEDKEIARKKVKSAKKKRDMIEELLLGTVLDQMFATPHNFKES